MPLVRALGGGLWEVRIRLDNRIARLIFCVEKSSIVLLHGFIKKQQSTPITELDLAKQRLRQIKRSTQ
jgi:phage-related protein